MPFYRVRSDITKMRVDAIVNSTNTSLAERGAVCGDIFQAAGAAELRAACEQLAPIQIGEAVITSGFALPAKFIIHTAGPIYRGGKFGEEEQLRACYLNSLQLAVEHGCESIAFPLISSGLYGYPKDEALRLAAAAIHHFLSIHDITVVLVVYDAETVAISDALLREVESYIDEHFVGAQRLDQSEHKMRYIQPRILSAPEPSRVYQQGQKAPARLDDLIGKLDEPFSTTLLRLIDAKGRTDVQIYKRANLDRKLFSKIRTGKDYTPSKRTAIALAIALELSIEETVALLGRAGYTLSRSQMFDVVVEYFIRQSIFDIFTINEALFKYDLSPLGG